jgi:hypothetical protein
MSERRSGSREATTFRKLPIASPGSTANAPRAMAIYPGRTTGLTLGTILDAGWLPGSRTVVPA